MLFDFSYTLNNILLLLHAALQAVWSRPALASRASFIANASISHPTLRPQASGPTPCPSQMASLIAILDLKGKPLIQRSYRDDVPSSYVERFLPLVLDIEEEGQQVTPCFSSQGVNYVHIRHSNLYRLSSTHSDMGHPFAHESSIICSLGSVETQFECSRNRHFSTPPHAGLDRVFQRA
jgi:hypothetical protein